MHKRRRLNRGLFVCGVETEVEVNRDAGHRKDIVASRLLDADRIGLFYCKSDSSISYGFEVVTHPFSFDWMRQNPEALQPLFDLRKAKCTSYNTSNCGMHIHIARTSFKSKIHMLKFASMFFRYHDFVFRMSRRQKDTFEHYTPDNVDWRNIQHIVKAGGHGGHRYVLNFLPAATIEVRLFKGTLNPRGWYANVEFVKAVYDFSAETGIRDITPKNFSGWSAARSGSYPNYLGVLGRLLPSQEGWRGLCA